MDLINAPMTTEMSDRVVRELVKEKARYRAVSEDEHVLLFERIEKEAIASPPTTVGLGWLKNVLPLSPDPRRSPRSGHWRT